MMFALPTTASQGVATGHALGHGHQVAFDTCVLHAEESAGAGKSCLDFIGNQDDPVFVAEFAQSVEELHRRRIKATLTLDRLHDDGGHIAGGDIHLEQAVQGV